MGSSQTSHVFITPGGFGPWKEINTYTHTRTHTHCNTLKRLEDAPSHSLTNASGHQGEMSAGECIKSHSETSVYISHSNLKTIKSPVERLGAPPPFCGRLNISSECDYKGCDLHHATIQKSRTKAFNNRKPIWSR